MKEFEKALIAQGSRYLILLFARIYQNELSQEFKDYVAEHFPAMQDKEELLNMDIKDFFRMYAKDEKPSMVTHLFNLFYAYNIEKVSDLLGVRTQDFVRLRTAGAQSLASIKRICANAGLEFK